MDLESDFFEEDLDIYKSGNSEEDNKFDYIIGLLQETLISDQFLSLKNNFFYQHSAIFTEEGETRLEHIELYQQYIIILVQYIEKCLVDMDLQEFSQMLIERQEEVDESLCELLLSFTDFEIFKELMINNNYERNLCVFGGSSVIYTINNQDKGEEITINSSSPFNFSN